MNFIPPYILKYIAQTEHSEASSAAHYTLLNPPQMLPINPNIQSATVADRLERTIYNTNHTENLPGTLVRSEGEPESSDPDVNNAYNWLGVTYDFYETIFHYSSVDGQGYPLNATVHFDRNYDNAFWNGQQMVFGDGDHVVFRSFTRNLDVVAHELTHGVDQYNANLQYSGQSGALNESVSDVFGIMTLQWHLKQTAAQSDWIIGKGIFEPDIKGAGIRSMSHPGTAYDDPRIGKDPQVGSMVDYQNLPDYDDNGGVHINSGIPNRAFYLIATAIGGFAWEKSGKIWWETLTNSKLDPSVDFAGFANSTIQSAGKLFGPQSSEVQATQSGWQTVGVLGDNVDAQV